MNASQPPAKRGRNAAATRAAILDSALRAFARSGYDGVGVREIARAAGVTAMLVNRYFGSKEQLFAEAVDVSFAPPTVTARDREDTDTLAHDAATNLVGRTAPDAEELDPFLIMLKSVSNPRAAEIIRDAIARHAGRRLADQLPEQGQAARSELMLSVIAGVWLMRRVIKTPALDGADPEQLAKAVEAVFGSIIETPLSG
ncbi:MAG: transcriptional regulator [Mycobacterium sp.]|jgi:AcrR family transcriptional regulator|nr:transcriptional regulator [Mycobacterium sp.]